MKKEMPAEIETIVNSLGKTRLDILDLLPQTELIEKMISLVLQGPPPCPPHIRSGFEDLASALENIDTSGVKVVVFGGGTGLSNIIGGDSRTPGWHYAPFNGLKDTFPKTRSIVCVTDDGGSTGELLKDLPIIALGDLRHVLLSSIRQPKLQKQYDLSVEECLDVAEVLYDLFNYRFHDQPESVEMLLDQASVDLGALPEKMAGLLVGLLENLFTDTRLNGQLARPHCLGNLLLISAIYQEFQDNGAGVEQVVPSEALIRGICFLADLVGANPDAVMPCTTTPACLKVLYTNGVLVTGEHKSAHARRGCPVDRVFVEFISRPRVPRQVLNCIKSADIILFAPGSLFTSIIPILQVPGIAEAVRLNKNALKILVANLWIQKGETDLVRDDPGRRFYVSDLISAYHRNIPGGVRDIFNQILALGLRDIPGSILQRYAVEGKLPIYLDRNRVKNMGFTPLESRIFSHRALEDRRVIQHDSISLAKALQIVWSLRSRLPEGDRAVMPQSKVAPMLVIRKDWEALNRRLGIITGKLANFRIDKTILPELFEILWRHQDIPPEHLDYINGLKLVAQKSWKRCQKWDNVFSFYDPDDNLIKIRKDMLDSPSRFEAAFLVALGQSLLGNYAASKNMVPLELKDESLGKVFELTLRPPEERVCFFSTRELENYLALSRMIHSDKNSLLFTRLVNGTEGFTPPGLLFGLTYAWYLDNRFASHIEYKMAITRTEVSNLIPEQVRIYKRRQTIIDFFRKTVFRNDSPVFEESLILGMKAYSLPEFNPEPDAASLLNVLVRARQGCDAKRLAKSFTKFSTQVEVHPEKEFYYFSVIAETPAKDEFLQNISAMIDEYNNSGKPIHAAELVETRMISDLSFYPLERDGNIRPDFGKSSVLSDYNLVLESARVFGTGLHPSTRLAIMAMEDMFRYRGNPPANVLDVGCGTGVLGLVSARLGAAKVLGIDIDADAVAVARKNVLRNRLFHQVIIKDTPFPQMTGPFDLILANLIPNVVRRMIGDFGKILHPGGSLVLSGGQGRSAENVSDYCQGHGIMLVKTYRHGPWRALLLEKS